MKPSAKPAAFAQVEAAPGAAPLVRQLRHARLPAIPGMPPDAGDRLDALRLLQVGAGSVGRPIAQHLARLAIGALAIIDPKSYRAENLVTQPAHPAELGQGKAEVTAGECKTISPPTKVSFRAGRFEDLSLADVAEFDAVVLAGDSLELEAAVGQSCLHLGLPLLHAAVHGATMVVQVKVYGNRTAGSAAPACGFSDAEREALTRQVRYSCDAAAPAAANPTTETPPTAATAALCTLASSLAGTQLLRFVLGLGQPVEDTELEFCAFTNRAVVSPLPRRQTCSCDHFRYRTVRLPRPLSAHSPAELAALLGPGDGVRQFEFGGHVWVEAAICPAGHRRKVRRLLPAGQSAAGTCDRCRATLHCQPFFTHRQVTPLHLAAAIDRPLAELGAPDLRWALVRDGNAGVLALNP